MVTFTNETLCHYFYRYLLMEKIMSVNIEGITGGIQEMKRLSTYSLVNSFDKSDVSILPMKLLIKNYCH
jgi:hypothetical protein